MITDIQTDHCSTVNEETSPHAQFSLHSIARNRKAQYVYLAACHIFPCLTAPRHHYVRELIEDNFVEVTFVPSEENIADIFTKKLNGKITHFALKRIF
jgi:hypothetical protein